MPLRTNWAGVSPGCTLQVRKTVYFSNLKGLSEPVLSVLYYGLSGNKPGISSSRS